ncbi:hypothetical protein CHH28_16640 [Bacterioplanes sanyensis]|uniref:Uncharacterized protein n=1 Tax=Bacterioplanes sanyensis TaxID=1249553 RepID=A0A222FNE2_9GAMM|nr:hypothetical protein [Bacterioplanes sanyensis]ASP40202.1 hypothetical protein CHH28_16640 [Bacterioplanes sanyensis]
MSQLPSAVLSCESWAASSRYSDWLNLLQLKQQGLSLATAYDLGEQALSAPQTFDIEITNTSADQTFNLSNPALLSGNGFDIESSDCAALTPGQRCVVEVQSTPELAQTYQDMVTLEVDNLRIGTYVAAAYRDQGAIAGDGVASWTMLGWGKTPNGSVMVDNDSNRDALLVREQVVANPKIVEITYRAPGSSSWHMFLNVNRQGLFGDGANLVPANTLSGTEDQWVTREFEITEPGLFRVSVTPGLSLIGQPQPFTAEIAQICIDGCDN